MGDHDSEYYDGGLVDVHAAILSDDYDKLLSACESGVDVNQKFTPDINPNHTGMTPLALASALNKYDLVEVLIDNGADVNTTFATLNTTALMTSSFHGHVDVVRVLLESGANVRAVDLQQSTALGYCFGGTRHIDVVNLLLDAGVDVNQKNMLGMNALLLVSGYGNDHLVSTILNAGADPNATNDFGHTALHLAVVGKRDQIKKMKKMGIPEAMDADRSLQRRNLDDLMQQWGMTHGHNAPETLEYLAKCGQFMMNIGQKLQDDRNLDDDDQETLKRRIEAVWNVRQEKLSDYREKKKPAIMSLLNCGGGKSKAVKKPAAKPFSPAAMPDPNAARKNDEVTKLSDKCTRIITMLTDAGIDLDRSEKTFGMTALDMAILNGDVESAAQLVCLGCDPDHLLKMFASSDLYQAIITMNRKQLKELLNCDEDLDVNQAFLKFNITRKDPVEVSPSEELTDEGLTPLAVAVKTNDFELVKLLLKRGANVNKVSYNGKAPLAEAANKGNLRMMQILLNEKADMEVPSPGYKTATPVTVAAMAQQHRAVDMLIKRGAKVDKRMSDGRTSLVKSMETRDEHMMDLLLNADLQINYIDQTGFMYDIARRYQAKDRDVEAIVASISEHCQTIQDKEDEEAMERQASTRSSPTRVTPQRGPPPQAQPPSPQQQPPPRQMGRRGMARAEYNQPSESSFAVEDQPSRADVVIMRQEPPMVNSMPPEPEHAPPVPPKMDEEVTITRTVVTNVRAPRTPQDEYYDTNYQPASPDRMDGRPMMPATSPPRQPVHQQEEEEETEEESEEESEEETESEEEDIPPPPPSTAPPALDESRRSTQTTTVTKVVQGQTGVQQTVQRTVVTKTVVSQQQEESEEETEEESEEEESEEEEETEEETEEESEEEESEEEESEEEESEEESPKPVVKQIVNQNIQKTTVVTRTVRQVAPPSLNTSHSNETEI